MASKKFSLTLEDTEVLKGIALLLLIVHHCLFTGEGYDDILIFGKPLFKRIGEFSVLCVSVFVFLSGYGLTKGALASNGIHNVFSFYRRRYMKLMVNYWIIYLLFVPLGVFVFHRSFESVYPINVYLEGLADFLGVHTMFFRTFGYMPVWWFYGCIIVLYLLYPLMWKYRVFWFLMIPAAILFSSIAGVIPVIGWSRCGPYVLSFVLGFVAAYLEIPSLGIFSRWIVLLFLISACVYDFVVKSPVLWNSVISFMMAYLYKSFKCPAEFIKMTFRFLGKHSFNIFLFHMFIYVYYFHDLIYWSRNPIVICLTLLLVCVPISIFIDWIKKVFGIDALQKRIVR